MTLEDLNVRLAPGADPGQCSATGSGNEPRHCAVPHASLKNDEIASAIPFACTITRRQVPSWQIDQRAARDLLKLRCRARHGPVEAFWGVDTDNYRTAAPFRTGKLRPATGMSDYSDGARASSSHTRGETEGRHLVLQPGCKQSADGSGAGPSDLSTLRLGSNAYNIMQSDGSSHLGNANWLVLQGITDAAHGTRPCSPTAPCHRARRH